MNEMYDIKNFTLDEKITFLCGIDNWHVFDGNGKLPMLHLSDGPCGLRKIDENGNTVKSTAMPSISALTNTWSKECAYLDGSTIADDCIENDVDVLLAPGVNIKRTPLCGRNFEYFSEDPYLAGELAYEFIRGVQDKGIGTSLKHYLGNNSESDRRHKNSEIDERTLREIYLPAFERAAQAKPYTVMCSYNLINSVFASESKKYLDEYLRGEFGFDGVIVSDWDACKSAYRSALASLDIAMPYADCHRKNIEEALKNGYITESDIDKCVERILKLIERCQHKKAVTTTKEQRHENAVKIAKEGIVLLKNEGALPLAKGKIALAGALAKKPVVNGGGSSEAKTDYVSPHLAELLQEKMKDSSIRELTATASSLGLIHLASELYSNAFKSDMVVICIGNEKIGGEHTENECRDRRSIKLTAEQEALISKVAKYNKNVVVVLFAGGVVDMSAWIDNVNAVLLAGFSGEGVYEALASILSGEISPCGKLSETFPICLEDVPADVNIGELSVRYSEGVFVGYRHYDTYGVPVRFPFGHGLSYANFEYSDLEIKKISDTDFEVCYNITNTSDIDASEISQVYVRDVVCHAERPQKELKGFSKDFIPAHQTKRVCVPLNYRSFAYYNVGLERWHVENGDFEIMVGASVADIRLSETIDINMPEKTQISSNEYYYSLVF